MAVKTANVTARIQPEIKEHAEAILELSLIHIFLSGIHAYYEPEELVGKTLIAITNLPPRKMMGIESCGMLPVSYTHL